MGRINIPSQSSEVLEERGKKNAIKNTGRKSPMIGN